MEQPQPTTEAAGGASDVERVVRPIEAGTEIEYCGQRATVWHDDGSDRIEVECEGSWQKWWWEFEGAECRIVRPNIELTGSPLAASLATGGSDVE